MSRYNFLTKESWFSALNKLRSAFLAAKDGDDVELVINAILTSDEKLKIGRRMEIAELLLDEIGIDEICSTLKVGKSTVSFVSKSLENYPKAFDLIQEREQKIETDYKSKAYNKVGGSKMVFKKREHTGFKRKDVKR